MFLKKKKHFLFKKKHFWGAFASLIANHVIMAISEHRATPKNQ